jgi:hypothetical protein
MYAWYAYMLRVIRHYLKGDTVLPDRCLATGIARPHFID